jgi:signal peptidase II
MGVVAFLWWRLPENQDLGAVGYSLIFTGAVGNLLDRVHLGEVVDFLDFHLGQFHWPAFNVADSLVCIGAGLLLWFILKEEQSQDVSHPV